MQATLDLLGTVHRRGEIEAIVEDSGLDPAALAWDDRPSLTWRAVLKRAAATGAGARLAAAVVRHEPGLEQRLVEIWGDEPPRGEPGPVTWLDLAAWRDLDLGGFSSTGSLEAVIGARATPFTDIAFLALGIERAAAVCRLVTRFSGNRSGTGSGFRVGEREILTAYHVVHDLGGGGHRAGAVEAWFHYDAVGLNGSGGIKAPRRVPVDVGTIIGERDYDWALVQAHEPLPDDVPVLPIGATGVPGRHQQVFVVQHPGGGPKKIALKYNLFVAANEVALQYWASTELGSSGAAVFDEKWDVVGLHSRVVEADRGDYFGSRNLGIRTDFVAARIRQVGGPVLRS